MFKYNLLDWDWKIGIHFYLGDFTHPTSIYIFPVHHIEPIDSLCFQQNKMLVLHNHNLA